MNITNYLRERAPLHHSKESLIEAAMKEFGVSRYTIKKKMWDISVTKSPLVFNGGIASIPDKKVSLKGLSESEIREKHDLKFILCSIVKRLERGMYITDADFIKQCNIRSHVGYRQALEDPDFRMYKGRANGITYWSHPDSITKMKEEGILSQRDMVTYTKKGRRHYVSMTGAEFDAFAEVIYLLNHTPPPVGFNRKPLTSQQKAVVENIYNSLSYHPEYKTYLNKKTDQ